MVRFGWGERDRGGAAAAGEPNPRVGAAAAGEEDGRSGSGVF